MLNKDIPLISIVVPVYNSAVILPELVQRAIYAVAEIGECEIILVDDGSTDESWNTIQNLATQNKKVKGVKLYKNSGQWAAILAGLYKSNGQYLVTIDDDLEYDPADIVVLYKTFLTHSYKVVFGMAPNKYAMQGKSTSLSFARKKILDIFWGTPTTDSFKFFHREAVFKQGQFLPSVLLDAYMARTLVKKDYGYTQVNFNQRYWGSSNHSFIKKVRLFFLYTMHYGIYPIAFAIIFFLFMGFIATYLGGLAWKCFFIYMAIIIGGGVYILWQRNKLWHPQIIGETINL